jgi:elongation factor P
MKANDIKPGGAVRVNNDLFVITSREHVKPGKGPAYVQVKMKSIATGNVLDKRLRATEEVEDVTLDRREMEYLYSEPAGHVFMDNESYEQMTISDDLIGDQMIYVKPNTTITVLLFEGRPVSVELPAAVDLEVTETAPQVKGATATNQLKEAELETGLKTRVPPFVENGQVVRVSTADGSYISRV